MGDDEWREFLFGPDFVPETFVFQSCVFNPWATAAPSGDSNPGMIGKKTWGFTYTETIKAF